MNNQMSNYKKSIMKKVLLLALVLGFGFNLMAQRAEIPANLKNIAVKVNSETIFDMGSNTSSDVMPLERNEFELTETQIGNSQYDLQSNAALTNRAYRHTDGTMVYTWTMGLEASSFADRGAGYNYFDGSSWGDIPTERIEDERTGWPFYAPLGANGEIIVSHGPADGLKLSTRDTKGTGDWSYSVLAGPDDAPGLTWPRVCASGDDNEYLHIIANSYDPYMDQDAALIYNRSNDGGATWMDNNIVFPGVGSDDVDQVNADDYILESKGNTVVMVHSASWNNLIMMKSTDNGDNWEKTIVWENPYNNIPLNDIITTDTVWSPDGSLAAEIDDEGKVHLTFGLSRYLKEEEGDSWSYFPYTDGIIYWNEDMDPFTNENQHYALNYDNLTDDVNYIGWTPDVDGNGTIDIESTDVLYSYRTGGMSTQVAMQLDADGNLVVLYTVPMETLFSGTHHYRHVYGRVNQDGIWLDPVDLTGGDLHMFDECIYPQMANVLPGDDSYHIFYSKDNTPGLALDEDHDWVDNAVIYIEVTPDELGVANENVIANTSMNTVSQNYPNPFNGVTTVDVEVAESANLSMDVVNLVGQVVYRVDAGFVNAGSHTLQINGSSLETGVYFYNVRINDETITKKMVIK